MTDTEIIERLATEGKLRGDKGTIIVDPEDEWMLFFNWYEHRSGNNSYARAKITRNGWHKHIFLHRAIMRPPCNMVVDHINGNGLDNRRSNLRVCCKKKNALNSRSRGTTSKFKGVSWHSKDGGWRMQIGDRGNRIIEYFGRNREEDAARRYDYHAKRLFGDFAFLNFPHEL